MIQKTSTSLLFRLFTVFLFGMMVLPLASCSNQKLDADPFQAFIGTWDSTSNDMDAELVIRSDRTFHVHLEPIGIDAEGTVTVDDPAPGVYNYMMNGNRATFFKVSDPLERRAMILSGAFVKAE
jgi:hypothetical protein